MGSFLCTGRLGVQGSILTVWWAVPRLLIWSCIGVGVQQFFF